MDFEMMNVDLKLRATKRSTELEVNKKIPPIRNGSFGYEYLKEDGVKKIPDVLNQGCPIYILNAGAVTKTSEDPLQEERFKKKNSNLINKLTNELHFNKDEMESILLIFHLLRQELAPKELGLNRHQLQDILHAGFDMTDKELTERVISAFNKHSGMLVDMDLWARMLSLFLRGTFEEKVQHCFKVYDERGTGFISKDTILHLMQSSLITQHDEDNEEIVKDLVSLLCLKLDVDRDGKVNYKDFHTTVTKEPLLMEALGQCLPSRHAVHTFLTTFAPNLGKF